MKSLIAFSLLGLSCASASFRPQDACTRDEQCGSNRVCYANGCGDPGLGLVVEVTGDNTSFFAQDIALSKVSATVDLEVKWPITLVGRLQRRTGSAGELTDYAAGVTLTAEGESELIPGVRRRYTQTTATDSLATYEMPIGTGRFTVTAVPPDKTLPPQSLEIVASADHLEPTATFTFQGPDEGLVFTGRLFKMSGSSGPVLAPDMSLQAFENVGGAPLSQLVPVDPATGKFELHLDDRARFLSSLAVIAIPGGKPAPTKTFIISKNSGTELQLELGDFGETLAGVSGRIVDERGNPIVKASVRVAGTVAGGGFFRSPTAVTDTAGGFSLDLLANAPNEMFQLTVIPPPDGTGGIWVGAISVGLLEGKAAFLTMKDGKPARETNFVCPDRTLVSGKVVAPDGAPGVAVTVEAVPIDSEGARPMPLQSTKTTTDRVGEYQLRLDPAQYRLDFTSKSIKSPRKSRFIRVESKTSNDMASNEPLDLGEFKLSTGRVVNGRVSVKSSYDQSTEPVPAGNARVRFYRVTSVEGVPSSLLVGETISDDQGQYSIVLPDQPGGTVSAWSIDSGTPDGG